MMADPTPVTFDVEVRNSSEVLRSGTMHVSDRSAANFSRQKNDASLASCASNDYRYGSERSALTINLAKTQFGRDRTGYNLRVSWERPWQTGDCDLGRSSRAVSLTEGVTAEPDRDVTINGDGGLVVRLRRR